MSEPGPPLGDINPAVMQAVRRLLVPLVRMLLRHGVTYPHLLEILKQAFVDVAGREFQLPNRRQTDSRLTLLTGVHRKDIRRLTREPDERRPRSEQTLGVQVIGRWLSEARFLDDEGKPKPLPRTPSAGGEDSFAALAESVSKNIRPRAVLDELLRVGAVSLDAVDRVVLNEDAFIPAQDLEAKLFYFAEAVHDHLAAGVHNLDSGARKFLERSVYYDELTPESIARLERSAETAGMRALRDINRIGQELERADPPREGRRQRMRFGIYFYSEPYRPAGTPPGKTTADGGAADEG